MYCTLYHGKIQKPNTLSMIFFSAHIHITKPNCITGCTLKGEILFRGVRAEQWSLEATSLIHDFKLFLLICQHFSKLAITRERP